MLAVTVTGIVVAAIWAPLSALVLAIVRRELAGRRRGY